MSWAYARLVEIPGSALSQMSGNAVAGVDPEPDMLVRARIQCRAWPIVTAPARRTCNRAYVYSVPSLTKHSSLPHGSVT